MRIAVMAAGGVGGYFGARLAASGCDVSFLARGAHLKALRSYGMRIESPLGDLHLDPVTVTDDAAEIGPVDLVIFAVKLWDTEEGARACRPLLGKETAVVAFQNGVESIEILSRELGAEHVIGGTSHISATIAAPGLIHHSGTLARLTFGEVNGRRTERVEAFFDACRKAKIEAVIAEDIQRAIWEKFIFLVALSGTTTVARAPIGPVLADPDLCQVFRSVVEETAALGRAGGVALEDDVVERTMEFAAGRPDDMTSSMLRDLRAGNKLEAAWLSGAVSRMSRECGIPAPVNETLYAVLKPYVEG